MNIIKLELNELPDGDSLHQGRFNAWRFAIEGRGWNGRAGYRRADLALLVELKNVAGHE